MGRQDGTGIPRLVPHAPDSAIDLICKARAPSVLAHATCLSLSFVYLSPSDGPYAHWSRCGVGWGEGQADSELSLSIQMTTPRTDPGPFIFAALTAGGDGGAL